MNKNQENKISSDRQEKKAYVRPQLVKQGNVETLTQGIVGSPSCPIKWDV